MLRLAFPRMLRAAATRAASSTSRTSARNSRALIPLARAPRAEAAIRGGSRALGAATLAFVAWEAACDGQGGTNGISPAVSPAPAMHAADADGAPAFNPERVVGFLRSAVTASADECVYVATSRSGRCYCVVTLSICVCPCLETLARHNALALAPATSVTTCSFPQATTYCRGRRARRVPGGGRRRVSRTNTSSYCPLAATASAARHRLRFGLCDDFAASAGCRDGYLLKSSCQLRLSSRVHSKARSENQRQKP